MIRLEPDLLAALSVVAGVTALSLLGTLTFRSDGGDARRRAKEMVAQALDYHRMAQRAGSSTYTMRHAAMSVAYLHAARGLLPDETLRGLTGVDVHEAMRSLEAQLRRSTKAAASASVPSASASASAASVPTDMPTAAAQLMAAATPC
jgi:Flp pilus assembly protein TadB